MAHPNNSGNGVHQNGASVSPYSVSDDLVHEEITLQDILDTVLKGKWIILGCFVLSLALAAAYTLRQAPQYEASSTLFVAGQQSSPQLGELLGMEGGRRNIANEIEILKSRAIAMRVARSLIDLRYMPGTDEAISLVGAGDPPTPLEVAQRVRRRISVRPVSREVDIIELTATSTDPEEAVLIANLYADEFVRYNRASSRERMSASREFLGDVTTRFDSMLTNAEQQIMQFSERESVVAPEQEAEALLQQISQLEAQRYETLFALRAAQAERDALEAELNSIRPGLAQAITSNDDQLIEGLLLRITQLQIQMEEKLSRNPRLRGREVEDPDLAMWQQQLEQLQGQLAARTARLTEQALSGGGIQGRGSLENTLTMVANLRQNIVEKEVAISGAQARLSILDQSLGQYRGALNDIPNKAIVRGRLERNLQTSEQLFTTMYEKLQEARIAEQSELGYVSIIDDAIVNRDPVKPRVENNLLMGALFGLMLGVGLAFLRTTLDNRIRRPEELRKRGITVLSAIPDVRRLIKKDFQGQEFVTVDGHRYSTGLVALLNPLSPSAEGYRRLRTNIQFSRPDKAMQVIMVTSPGPGEGKTMSSMNLAITLAQSGRRTLFVDADLRRPTGHRMLGTPRDPGLVDLLFEAYPAGMERFATSVDDLFIVPAGSTVPNPAEILGSKKMLDFIARMRDEFDAVVIDTPPVMAVADAMLVARQCDGTVLVCSAGDTTWPALERANETLHDVGAKIVGVVLNRFDPKAAYGGYGGGYGYGYGYYEYYGEQQPKPAKAVEKV